MKRYNWQIMLGLVLLLTSACVYLIHYAVFRDPQYTVRTLLDDIAFLPIQVLVVTLLINGLLEAREKSARMEKLNMAIGAFFSEVGTHLLTYLSDFDPKLENMRRDLIVNGDWSEQEFSRVAARLRNYEYGVNIRAVGLEELSNFLVSKRTFLLGLLENQNLLEHESFTDLLWAVFHLTEELAARRDFSALPDGDLEHLAGDSRRAYTALVHQWLDYMKHLKDSYPYLFSLAMRTNPFDQNASVILT